MNLFSLSSPQEQEESTLLWQSSLCAIERIVSWGQITDWQTQSRDEWVALLQGAAEISYENRPPVHLCAGDTLLIPAGTTHRVSFTSNEPPSIWLCVLPLSALSAFVWRLPPIVTFLFLKSDQFFKCIPNGIVVNRYRWVRVLTRESK